MHWVVMRCMCERCSETTNQVLMARATRPRPTFAHVISPSKGTLMRVTTSCQNKGGTLTCLKPVARDTWQLEEERQVRQQVQQEGGGGWLTWPVAMNT